MGSETDARPPRIGRDRPRNGVLITTLFVKKFGFSRDALADVGTLFLAWSLFENDVEAAIWRLTTPPAPGERPATDRMQSAERLRELARLLEARVSDDQLRALEHFTQTAVDVLAYRNAIAHGRPHGGFGGQLSVNNFPRIGEKRKRPMETAHLYPTIIKLALEAVEALTFCMLRFVGTKDTDEAIRLMLSDRYLSSARSAANEARNIASLINNEKY